jgi:hypothetical protein
MVFSLHPSFLRCQANSNILPLMSAVGAALAPLFTVSTSTKFFASPSEAHNRRVLLQSRELSKRCPITVRSFDITFSPEKSEKS